MKIAFDAAPLLGPRTGIGHYAASLLEHLLEESGIDSFELFAITTKQDDSRIPRDPRVRLHRMNVPARLAVSAWSALGKPPGERFTGAADVVHGTNFWVPPLERKNGLVTIHDLTFILHPELCTPQIQRYSWIVPKVLESCALVLVPSETVKDQVCSYLHVEPANVRVTPEGVRNAFISAVPDERLTARLGVRGDYVLFAGTQEPRKNLDRLIEAVAELTHSEVSLVIAGPPGWGSIDLPAVAQKLGVESRVVFSGYLTDSELGSLLKGSRAFVFPTLYEGFGLPPLEAMAAGIPVVASRAGSLPEVLEDAAFWCDPLDVPSIAAAIDSALGDESRRNAAIERGTEVAAKFSWRETARLTLEAYEEIAAG